MKKEGGWPVFSRFLFMALGMMAFLAAAVSPERRIELLLVAVFQVLLAILAK